MPQSCTGDDGATASVIATAVLALAATGNLSANEQNALANLLFVAAQVISTRASLIPAASDPPVCGQGQTKEAALDGEDTKQTTEARLAELERRLAELTGSKPLK